jgi:hypothetical protein
MQVVPSGGMAVQMDIERFLSRALQVIGLGKKELAASYFATCDECDCDTLAQKAEPGDHIAVWDETVGYWHHGIFVGIDGGSNYVIDMTPDSGIARRLLWQFLKSADGAAIIRYDRALSRENTLSLASVFMEYTNTMDPPPAYDIAKRNCDIFAASCRLGRYVKCRLAPKGEYQGGAPSRSSKLRVYFG